MRPFLLVAIYAIQALAATTAARPVVHVRNFGVVNEHLMRGGEPTPDGLSELHSAGTNLVIDLREPGAGTVIEKQQVEKLGMKYTNIPFPPMSAPSPDLVRSVLDLLARNGSQTVFLHCHRGKDRTGTVVACYRIQHDGWDNNHALQEANQFGMSSLERGMRAFIAHFTPAANVSDSPALLH